MATWRTQPERLRLPIALGRVRHPPNSGFGWIDRRLVTFGHLAQLTPPESLLYFFLCTVADVRGLSFWGDRRTCIALRLSQPDLDRARIDLESRGLILYRYPIYQLLPLPHQLEVPKERTPQRNTSACDAPTNCTSPKTIAEILWELHFPHQSRSQRPQQG